MFKWNSNQDIDELALTFWSDAESLIAQSHTLGFSRAYRRVGRGVRGYLSRNASYTRKMWKRVGNRRARRAHRAIANGYSPRKVRPVSGWDVD